MLTLLRGMRPLIGPLAGNAGAFFATSAVALLTARYLGPSGRGHYATIVAWSGFAAMLAGGSVGHGLRIAVAMGRIPVSLNTVRRWLGVSSAIGIVVGVAGVMNSTYVAISHIVIAMVLTPCLISIDWSAHIFEGGGRSWAYAYARSALPWLTFLSQVALVIVGSLWLTSALVVLAAAGAVSALASMRLAATTAQWSAARSDLRSARREVLTFSRSAHIGTVGSYLIARVDVLLLSVIGSPSDVGLYSVALAVATPAAIVGASLGAARFRSVAQSSVLQRSGTVAGVRSIAVVLAVSALLSLTAITFLALLRPLLGTGYSTVVLLSIPIAMGSPFMALGYFCLSFLHATGRPSVATALSASGAVLESLCVPVLFMAFGVAGVSLATAITYVFVGVSGWVLVRPSSTR